MSKRFAVFDIDGTLIRWQMFHAIVHHLGKLGYIDAQTHQAIKSARMIWKNRESAKSYGEYESQLINAYRASLANISPDKYQQIVNDVFEEYKDQLFVYTRDMLHDLKSQQYTLFAISGSQSEIIQKLARYHGFDDYAAAELVIKDNRFTGDIITPVIDKATALDDLVKKHRLGYDGSIGFGDTKSDISMLQKVDTPIAFNPNDELYSWAKIQGWQIVVERKNVVYELTHTPQGYYLK